MTDNIYNYSEEDLKDIIKAWGLKPYVASQIFRWLYKGNVSSFEEMSNISKKNQELLSSKFSLKLLDILVKEEDDLVKKYLLKLDDLNTIEAVLMEHDYGLSLCVSSQIGCNMGCKFCQSGTIKKVRNLRTDEMVRQILTVQSDIKKIISHVVIMGIGEPLDNLENILKFIDIINNPLGLEIGIRHITLSTCGLVPKIKEITDRGYRFNLAVSLHSAIQKKRELLMPIAKLYDLEKLKKVLIYYEDKLNKRITFEYIMLDINDKEEDAIRLVNYVKNLKCYINLIPYNETNLGYKRSSNLQMMKFYDIIKKHNIDVTIRREFGGNISGACGQLKSGRMNK